MARYGSEPYFSLGLCEIPPCPPKNCALLHSRFAMKTAALKWGRPKRADRGRLTRRWHGLC